MRGALQDSGRQGVILGAELRVEFELWHHVYSSMKGYRTLFSSPELPPDVAARAEEIARKLYRIVGTRPEHGFYHAGEGFAASLKAFHFGTDHAGRARTCVHTVFLRESELARLPGFSPLDLVDDLYLPEDTNLDYLSGELRKAWTSPDEEPPHGAGIHANWTKLLLPPLLEASVSTVVVDPSRHDAFAMIAALAHALPPALRRSLTFLDGAVIDPTTPPTFQITVCDKLPEDMVFGPDVALIDLKTRETKSLPPANAYADFVAASLAPGGNPEDIRRFIAVLEKHEPERRFTPAELHSLAGVWPAARLCFRKDGAIATSAPADGCDSVQKFHRAGATRIGIALLEELIVAHAPQVASPYRQRLRELGSSPSEPALHALVKEARKLLGLKPAADDDTNFELPDSDTIANHMMEDSSDDDLHLDADKA